MRPLRALSATAAVLGLGPLLGASGCDETHQVCTLIGCNNALVVALAPAADGLSAGRYAVTAASADAFRQCAFTAAAGGAVSDVSEDCRGLSPTGDGTFTATLEPVRGEVRVTVERDGSAVGGVSVRPAYEPQYPNGVDCGAACEVARTVVPVD